MNKFLKSLLKTAIYLLDQSDRVAADLRERVADGVDRVNDRVSDLTDRAQDYYGYKDHTLRNVISFAAGVGVGIGAGMLLAPASGEEIRNSIGEKVQDVGARVRNGLSFEGRRAATGTEGR